ncbi:MAG TPA: alkaline phosphatase family protein [Candidatus Dormibacteraeota bacterium]|nr:alkaline phosphatase family protein [Candidatus Dormibacteraeota bacterium]
MAQTTVLTRRRFIQAAAAMGAAVAAFPAFPAVRVGRAAGTPLRHIVLLMQENRSFDHYFGRFPGADGLPADAPARAATADCLNDPPHNQAALDRIAGSDDDYANPAALTAYGEAAVPVAWALARRFTLCDRYFASVLGPTFVNRLFSLAATGAGFHDNPDPIPTALLPRPTIVDRLDAAGVSWACYLAQVPDRGGYEAVAFYPERQADPRANRPFSRFLADAATGRLPAVSWVVPADPLSEHPPTPPQWGQHFAGLAVRALMSGPLWRSSALVLNYDESGGFYDHVAAPAPYGFRVPCTVVSPYAKPGHVSHEVFDHASVLALIETTFGLRPLTGRDASASPLADCFDFDHATLDPVVLPASPAATGCPPPPPWAAELLAMPLDVPARPAAVVAGGPRPELVVGLGGVAVGAAAGAAIGLRGRLRR